MHSHTCTQHICFRTRVSRAEKKFAFVAAPLAWSWRAGGTVTSALFPIRANEWREAAAPSIHRWRFAAERRPSYRSFSVAWDKESIVMRLVLPRFKTPARRGTIHRHTPVKKKKKRRWRSRYSSRVPGWKCFIAWPWCWQPALMENFLTQLFSFSLCLFRLALSFLWTAASRGWGSEGSQTPQTTQKSQQMRHMVAKEPSRTATSR